jgi:hypothetical protein
MADPKDGSPRSQVGFLARFLILLLAPLALAEYTYQLIRRSSIDPFTGPLGRLSLAVVRPLLVRYVVARRWVIDNPWLAGAIALTALTLVIIVARSAILFWCNWLRPRLSGTYFAEEEHTFPSLSVNLMRHIRNRPPGTTFVGVSPRRRLFGWTAEPVYLDERQRSTHCHVIGKTGSGKTQSVLFPQALQDILDGKGVVVMSAKGSNEEIETMKALARHAGREDELRIFSLPAWNRPEVPTHTYNMVYVAPIGSDRPGDPVATAERVFKVLPMGDNVFYNQQAQIMFRNLCCALHGMLDANGNGIPFVMRDIAVCLKGVGALDTPYGSGLEYVLKNSTNKEAVNEIRSQVTRLGHEIHKVLSGLVGAVDQFLSPIVNAYDPDLVMETALETHQIVYIQLPSNLFKIQAPSLGKVFLQDIQQEGSLRQLDRSGRDQEPFSVIVDEYARFADVTICDSLSQLRDARVEFTIAHQSLADLEIVSKEFSASVKDNTRVKIILNQDNPDFCEQIAKSIGTFQEVLHTIRKDPGPFFTSLQSGVASSRVVESYKLHPNRIKNLARFGQGWLYSDEQLKPLSFGRLDDSMKADYPLPAKTQTGARGLYLSKLVADQIADAETAAAKARADEEKAKAAVNEALVANARALGDAGDSEKPKKKPRRPAKAP